MPAEIQILIWVLGLAFTAGSGLLVRWMLQQLGRRDKLLDEAAEERHRATLAAVADVRRVVEHMETRLAEAQREQREINEQLRRRDEELRVELERRVGPVEGRLGQIERWFGKGGPTPAQAPGDKTE